jgi:hypothetical protein
MSLPGRKMASLIGESRGWRVRMTWGKSWGNGEFSVQGAARCGGVNAVVAKFAVAAAGVALVAILLGENVAAASTVAVDANAASAPELERVRGIGPALASRIVAARSTGGQFRDTDDFRRRVRGVGEANLRRMLASGLVLGGNALRIVPAKAAARDQVDLVVGNIPAKSEFRGLGRIEELRCCGSQEAGETQRQREPGRGAASAPEPPVKGSTAPQAASQATEPTASQAASTAPTEPAPRPRPRR